MAAAASGACWQRPYLADHSGRRPMRRTSRHPEEPVVASAARCGGRARRCRRRRSTDGSPCGDAAQGPSQHFSPNMWADAKPVLTPAKRELRESTRHDVALRTGPTPLTSDARLSPSVPRANASLRVRTGSSSNWPSCFVSIKKGIRQHGHVNVINLFLRGIRAT